MHTRCMAVTVSSPPVYVFARPFDRRLVVWLGSLAGLAVFNVAIWLWLAWFASPRTPYAETQLLLSGVYVAVCVFRSLFPRVDLERVCLWDTWLSGIVLGRTVATVAELCFALQCALLLERLIEIAGIPLLGMLAWTFVPLVVLAELVCWYAVLSLNHVGHAIEESLWALLMLALSAGCAAAAPAVQGPLRWMLAAGVLLGVGAGLMMMVDVKMYIRRWRTNLAGRRLTLAAGLRDGRVRRHPTLAWEVWREEVAWMTLYFSVGVWTSLAMVVL